MGEAHSVMSRHADKDEAQVAAIRLAEQHQPSAVIVQRRDKAVMIRYLFGRESNDANVIPKGRYSTPFPGRFARQELLKLPQ